MRCYVVVFSSASHTIAHSIKVKSNNLNFFCRTKQNPALNVPWQRRQWYVNKKAKSNHQILTLIKLVHLQYLVQQLVQQVFQSLDPALQILQHPVLHSGQHLVKHPNQDQVSVDVLFCHVLLSFRCMHTDACNDRTQLQSKTAEIPQLCLFSLCETFIHKFRLCCDPLTY